MRNKIPKKNLTIFAIQLFVICAAGIFSGDIWFQIILSALGLGFNFFTCFGKRFGFLLGAAYAIAYAVMGFHDKIYATAIFMLFVQLPVAVAAYFRWRKINESDKPAMKELSHKQSAGLVLLFFACAAGIWFVLNAFKSNGPLTDSVFFTITLLSCILLERYYRSAYLFVGLSGIAGIVLWSCQLIVNHTGWSLLALYACVFINSLSAVKQHYLVKK